MKFPDIRDIQRFLEYNKDTGVFHWLIDKNSNKSCVKVSGTLTVRGYITITFNSKKYLAHRLAWFYHTGDTSFGTLDHIDGNKTNNKISNLRLVTQRENCQNYKSHRDGRLVGSTYVIKKRKWRSQIRVNGIKQFLGYFDTEFEAHEAYKDAVKNLT